MPYRPRLEKKTLGNEEMPGKLSILYLLSQKKIFGKYTGNNGERIRSKKKPALVTTRYWTQ